MMRLRRAAERGHADHGWLRSAHTFSFAGYYDPAHMGFRALRVINEDRVDPGRGFPTHGHRDMEIVSVVLEGALEHEDSLGNGSVLRPGEVQRMTAGRGVYHSEYNASSSEELHFLQIWILPAQSGLPSGYEQRRFDEAERRGRLSLLVSPDGEDGSLTIHQDARLYGALLAKGEEVPHARAAGRGAGVQVARGVIELCGQRMEAGDGAAIEGEDALILRGVEPAEILLFDLA